MKADKYAPDLKHVPFRSGESVAEIVFSRDNTYRVVIAQRQPNLYHVYLEMWDVSDWEFLGRGYWNPHDTHNTFADTLETARELALEKLR